MASRGAASDAVTSWPMAQVRVAPSPAGDNTWGAFCLSVRAGANLGQRLWRFPQTYPIAGTTICSGDLWMMLLHIVVVSPCSSVDRAAASGAVCGRSNRPRGTFLCSGGFPPERSAQCYGFFPYAWVSSLPKSLPYAGIGCLRSLFRTWPARRLPAQKVPGTHRQAWFRLDGAS